MTIHCPHCSTGYVLPAEMLGGRGARVRCPSCGEGFTVVREPESGAVRIEPASGAAASPPAPAHDQGPTDPAALVARLLDELSERLGDSLVRSAASGHLLSEHGAELMRTFDEYRRTLGPRASTAAFRAAVKQRWGVDLDPASEGARVREGGGPGL